MDTENRRRDRLVNGLGIAGLALLSVGLWALSPAWALVSVGGLLVGFAIAGARR